MRLSYHETSGVLSLAMGLSEAPALFMGGSGEDISSDSVLSGSGRRCRFVRQACVVGTDPRVFSIRQEIIMAHVFQGISGPFASKMDAAMVKLLQVSTAAAARPAPAPATRAAAHPRVGRNRPTTHEAYDQSPR